MPNCHSVCQIPCVLRNHLQVYPLTNLSQPECEILFQHWVVTERKTSPSLSPTELLTCPLLWCGITFVDHESLLRHLKDCPRLLASGYWCPSCHRAESFASNKIPEPIPEPTSGSDNQRPAQKKPSRLAKLLRMTFKRKRATGLRQDPTVKLNLFPQELPGYQFWEMAGHGSRSELGTNDPILYSWEHDANVEKLEERFGSPYSHKIHSDLIEQDFRNLIAEMQCNSDTLELSTLWELPGSIDFGANVSDQPDPRSCTGGYVPANTSTDFNQSSGPSHPSHPSHPVPSLVVTNEAMFEQTTVNLGCSYADPKPARQDHINSQINGPNSASGSFGHQHVLFAESQLPSTLVSSGHTPSSLPPDYDPPYTQNQNSTLSAGSQGPWSATSFGRTPRSVPPGSGSPSTRNSGRICTNPINTTKVSAEYNHPNPETGSQNSPLSAGSSQTNTTWSCESAGTAPTPVTPFSALGSPVGMSPRNISSSYVKSSGQYICQECEKTFPDRSNCARHVKTHGEKVRIECRARCGQKFTRNDNEKRHYNENFTREQKKGDENPGQAGLIHLEFANQVSFFWP